MSGEKPPAERRLTLACVVDLLAPEGLNARQKAYDDVVRAAKDYKINTYRIEFDKLENSKETAVLDLMYSADVAIVDMSISSQQIALSGQLGARERFGMQGNFVIYNSESVHGVFKSSIGGSGMNSIGYSLSEDGERCVVTDSWMADSGINLYSKLKQLLKDVQVTTSTHAKEKFLDDLRKVREMPHDQLKPELDKLRQKMNLDPVLLSPEIVFNLLMSYRDIQDHDTMISIMDGVQSRQDEPNAQQCLQPDFMYWYCFALNRRNKPGDRDKALLIMERDATDLQYVVPDALCLCGRIYKDMFVESECKNRDYIAKAIEWYRKGFAGKPNEFAGINLATLLVVSGDKFDSSSELQSVLMQLNHMISRKGSLELLQEYWTVATFFEMQVLSDDYRKACQAAECMYRLKPQGWMIRTTMQNIRLIEQSRRAIAKGNDSVASSRSSSIAVEDDEDLYRFWLEFFEDSYVPRPDTAHFPVLILDDNPERHYISFYVTINVTEETAADRTIKFWQSGCTEGIEYLLKPEHVKSAALNRQDERCLFLYVAYPFSENLQVYFSSGNQRDRFHALCKEFLSSTDDYVDLDDDGPAMMYDYEYDKNGQRVLLGSGTFGRVYAAKNANTQVKMAVKEIRVTNDAAVQLLHDEIKLHSKLHHKNIVQYHGSVYENGFFKIFMEQVPGGSLSDLLRGWGPLKGNEMAIAFYSRQILEGLRYLHDQKIVHRDIKGGNVLVNTFSGVLKISDFGTSKRLSGLNSNASSFKGTFQYMAPEVIDAQGQRGYAAPADIWSFGCTVIEMAQGKPPFSEIQSPVAAMFLVGRNKSHPMIPEELGTECREFILSTFCSNPADRLTAACLLKHPFLREANKKRQRNNSVTSLNGSMSRSHSVPPADSVDASTLEARELVEKGVGTSNPSSAAVPTSPQPEQEISGSYWKRKHNETQIALLALLETERPVLIDRMMESFENNNKDGGALIDCASIETMIRLVEKCIQSEEGGRVGAKIVIEDFKGSIAPTEHNRLLKQLQLFLFLLKREVQDVLRNRSIKPHWMFAFDDMISRSVQIILQQMGMSFDDTDSEPEKREYTSQTSTSPGSYGQAPYEQALARFIKMQCGTAEIFELLIKAEERYQAVLRQMLEEKNRAIALAESQRFGSTGSTGSQ
ncbi:mitogen-activated protein kinase kinase kinase 15-like [Paramacrobiotus metropolitanus]|uniref:mitogen-activated protein kinase kinase kinase 15-like n=1 Tax=Paramacrobiotus metropolitanus TaxID=2943436 RepID=UPI0024456A49|nr:mitogen-activated protein kinase kinase kinase 15-like [Paramacrobiotus metropolitanus]